MFFPYVFGMPSIMFGKGSSTPPQYSCLENPMDGGASWAVVLGVAKSGYDWVTSLSLFTFMAWRRKWQPTPVFFPGESQGRGSLVGCHTFSSSLGWLGSSPEEGIGNPLQYSCLENPLDTQQPGGLESMELQRVGHDLATKQQNNHTVFVFFWQIF